MAGNVYENCWRFMGVAGEWAHMRRVGNIWEAHERTGEPLVLGAGKAWEYEGRYLETWAGAGARGRHVHEPLLGRDPQQADQA